MSALYRYRAYDLAIEAGIALPELVPWREDAWPSGGPDVSIQLGRVPARLDGATGSDWLQTRPDAFLLDIEGVARYLVRGGSQVLIDPADGASAHDVRVYLLGTCFGGLLHQRGLLVLHASAIADAHGATLLCGHSGGGKSTLLGELLARGHRMLVDDVCAITLDAVGVPIAQPAYPRTRLWADAARRLGRDVADLPRTQPDVDKFELQVPEHFWNKAAPVRAIYVLSVVDHERLHFEPLPVVERFAALLEHTYRRVFLDALEMQTAHFDLATAVAREVPVTRVVRSMTPYRLDELADGIEREVLERRAPATGSEQDGR